MQVLLNEPWKRPTKSLNRLRYSPTQDSSATLQIQDFSCRMLWKWFQSEASALTSWVGEHPNISQISVQSSTVKPDATLRRWNFFAPLKTCVWAFFCANPTIQQSSAMQEKKRSSKISKDHQRSKLQIQIIAAIGGISIAPRKGTRGLPLLKMGWC